MAKGKGGRPSTYDPAFCERVVKLAEDGRSEAEIAKALGVPRTTMRSWGDQHEEFSSALAHARDLSLAWWEEQGRLGLKLGSAFNASLYARCITGRFPSEPYRERVQIAGADDGPIELNVTDHERAQALALIMAKAMAA